MLQICLNTKGCFRKLFLICALSIFIPQLGLCERTDGTNLGENDTIEDFFNEELIKMIVDAEQELKTVEELTETMDSVKTSETTSSPSLSANSADTQISRDAQFAQVQRDASLTNADDPIQRTEGEPNNKTVAEHGETAVISEEHDLSQKKKRNQLNQEITKESLKLLEKVKEAAAFMAIATRYCLGGYTINVGGRQRPLVKVDDFRSLYCRSKRSISIC